MFDLAIHSKRLEFRCVLMDTWYASRQFMLHSERNGKIYYGPVQDHRQVDEGDGTVATYQRVDSLTWTEEEKACGKTVHVKDFPKGHRLQLFRLVVSPDRTDYVVTNDMTQYSTADTQRVGAIRWKTSAVAPRSQTSDRLRALPVSHCKNPTQSPRVCDVSVVSFQRTGLSNRTDGLSNQVRAVV